MVIQHCFYFEFLEVQCQDPGNITNATRKLQGLQYEDTATYTCNEGFFMAKGDGALICDADRQWFGSRPVCESKNKLTEQ